MQLSSHPTIIVPTPIIIPSAPILPEKRLVFGGGNNLDLTKVENPSEEPPSKKRKKDRACDYCRRRKIKCDGPWRQEQLCTNCLHGHRRCTYVESSKPRGPPKAYVTTLEDRIERLEGIVQQLCPNADFSQELGPPVVRGSWKTDEYEKSRESKSSIVQSTSNASLPVLKKPTRDLDFPMSQVERTTHLIFDSPRHPARHTGGRKSMCSRSLVSDSSDSASESDEDTIESGLGGRHKYGLSAIETGDELVDSRIRFHGRSSTAGLVEATRRFKHLCMQERGDTVGQAVQGRETGSKTNTVSRRNTATRKPDNTELQVFRRIEFWSTAKWESAWNTNNSHEPDLIAQVLRYFPPDPIANELQALFFCHTNPYLPLLHRPTFERYWHEGLHHENVWFATLCILIFAVASRWYDSGGEVLKSWLQGKEQWTAVGWKWFFVTLDVHCARRSLACPATLLEIQTFALMVIFLRGTTCLPAGWLFVSIGLRKAQDRGAHRRIIYKNYPNADDELWKRAFWILLAFDHILGASLGRGIATGQEDYDLDFPLEVDDEFWRTGNADTDFKQPDNVPSKISCFTQFLKLAEIVAFTAKTLYPVDKRRVFLGFVKGDWTGEVIRQLKMAMEEFTQKMPPHLQWNENDADSIFTRQAATIHSLYHCILMTQWRPFCAYNSSTGPRGDHNRQSTAMSQCAVSIKACGRILGVELQRGLSNAPMMINACLVCAGTLAIILWVLQKKMVASGKGKTQIRNFEIEKTGIYIYELLDAVDICMRVLDLKKSSWEYAESLVEQLKAALPSDKDDSFETLDIPMPSVQGISNLMRVSSHLHDGNSPPFEIPSDATFSFMGHMPYKPRTAYAQTLEGNGTILHADSLSSQSDVTALNRIHRNPVPFNHRSSDQLFSNATAPPANYPVSSNEGQSSQAGNLYAASRGLFPHRLPEKTRQPTSLQLTDTQAYTFTSVDQSAVSPESRTYSDCNSETFGPKPLRSHPPGAISTVHYPYETDKMQIKCHHAPRTRTTSLVDKPIPAMEVGSDIPCISNLRRTSFPNLRAKRDNCAGPLGSQSNKSVPNVAMHGSEFFQPTLNNMNTPPLPPFAPRVDSGLKAGFGPLTIHSMVSSSSHPTTLIDDSSS